MITSDDLCHYSYSILFYSSKTADSVSYMLEFISSLES